jgi:hypothetical protein
MYPIAWAVVEQESGDTWKWFLGLLIKDLDINDSGAGWVFISDKHKVHLILVDILVVFIMMTLSLVERVIFE